MGSTADHNLVVWRFQNTNTHILDVQKNMILNAGPNNYSFLFTDVPIK
jgi:hypothetical protein